MWIYNSSETTGDDHRRFKLPVVEADDRQDSTSSSSIGNNSDDASSAGYDSNDDHPEIQSPSLTNLHDLEDALVVKKGISTFYSGKSKSYTSLADAVCVPSIQDIVKPEDAYNRKRKNMLAHSIILNKNHNFTSKSGTSIKIANANMGSLTNGLNNNHHSNAGGISSSPGGSRPPLPARHRTLPTNESLNSPPRNYCSPWRSLSLSDLQHAAAAAAAGGGAASSFTGSLGNKRDEHD